MRSLPLLLWALSAVVGCTQAQPPVAAPPVMPQHVQTLDSAIADSLMARGGAAMRAEQWSEAERYFASAYERAGESQRREAAFFWGLALYRQGEAIARSNPRGEADATEATRRARQYFEDARSALQRTDHPMRDQVLKAIEEYLALPIEIADKGS